MSAPKLRTQFGFMAKVESTYGTAVALAGATDGILPIEPPDVTLEYVHDGSRQGRSVGVGTIKRVAKSGRSAKLTATVEAHGFGAAYSASNLPNVDRLLKAAGYGATVTVGAGTETVTYQPVASAFASLTAEAFVNAMKYALVGVYADLSASGQAGDIPKFEFPLSGIMPAVESDAAVPAITYPTPTPPKGESMLVTIGTYLPAIVKEWSFTLGRELNPRAYDNTNARHGGFSPGRINPMMELVVEMTALQSTPFHNVSGLHARELAERGTQIACSLIIGSLQYNKYKLTGPQAQIVDVEEVEDGPTSQWRLKIEMPPAVSGGVDGHNWLFN